MIIKEKSIKSYRGLENALRYVLTKGIDGTGEVMRRFVLGDKPFENALQSIENNMEEMSIIMENRIANMMGQYRANDRKRIHKRKGETKFYHSILSFHKEDRLTPQQLKQIARTYAKERYPNSMVVALPHFDRDHLHVHSLASSVEVGTGKTCYLTRKEFKEVKERMELWQDKHLNLKHSRVKHSNKARSLLKDAEHQLNLNGKLSEKQQMNMRLAEIYSRSTSEKSFFKALKKLNVYERNGEITGLQGEKRRYRLKTLGFSKERLEELNQSKLNNVTKSRLEQLKKLDKGRDRDIDRER
ncbi:hypothetical protein GCM10011344_27180 [Dokdonia pacifica]|uniref:Relaxase/Mobilisation nuclease domain-containing protein n=1 Tax=Dokdonia pacifica TaxID=1627892 RepID=A0A239E6A8_9FLAO|nr:relaxase/mobilization nuclease domain-containing protein [Dokdonia pacifica]GGG25083.1 hypothetical protein GCM10011344_27180 [Dokdonia pacifica]SNS40157.1 Relaxase/Mobilisation nuclease domain-containing protein [Dokdonia pacifica]